MREILFRAKAINRDPDADYRTEYQNGDWVYGWLTKPPNPYCPEKLPAEMRNEDGICGIDVDLDTVGQYTGLMDKNGSRIFEGDIVSYSGKLYEVKYLTKYMRFAFTTRGVVLAYFLPSSCEVVGNVHDDQELLND